MTPEEMFNAVVTYGLAVRQLPLTIELRGTYREILEHPSLPCTVHEKEIPDLTPELYAELKLVMGADAPGWRFDDATHRAYCKYITRTIVPQHAGYWMCQSTRDNADTNIAWDPAVHNLAPTLAESVQKYCDSAELKPLGPSIVQELEELDKARRFIHAHITPQQPFGPPTLEGQAALTQALHTLHTALKHWQTCTLQMVPMPTPLAGTYLRLCSPTLGRIDFNVSSNDMQKLRNGAQLSVRIKESDPVYRDYTDTLKEPL